MTRSRNSSARSIFANCAAHRVVSFWRMHGVWLSCRPRLTQGNFSFLKRSSGALTKAARAIYLAFLCFMCPVLRTYARHYSSILYLDTRKQCTQIPYVSCVSRFLYPQGTTLDDLVHRYEEGYGVRFLLFYVSHSYPHIEAV